MKKKTKLSHINSGNSIKFGLEKPRHTGPRSGCIIKYQRRTRQHFDADLETIDQNINDALAERLDDGGLLEGMDLHKGRGKFEGQQRRFIFRFQDDSSMAYSLNKRKRWLIAGALRKEICEMATDIEEEDEIDVNERTRYVLSLAERKAFYHHGFRNWWSRGFRLSGSHRELHKYYDSRWGAVQTKSYHSNLVSLREEKVKQDKKKKCENGIKDCVVDRKSHKQRSTLPTGHNQHFRGIQRKCQMKRKMKPSNEDENTEFEMPEHEVRYEIIDEKLLDSHPANMPHRAERTVHRFYYDLYQSKKALCKTKRGKLKRHNEIHLVDEQEILCDSMEDDVFDKYDDTEENVDSQYICPRFTPLNFTALFEKATSSIKTKATKRERSPQHSKNQQLEKSPKDRVIFIDYNNNFQPEEMDTEVPGKTDVEITNENEKTALAKNIDKFFSSTPKSSYLIFTNASICPKYLQETFGSDYEEGQCLHRKFSIRLFPSKSNSVMWNGSHVLFECFEMNVVTKDNAQTLRVRIEGDLLESERKTVEDIFARQSNDVISTDFLIRKLHEGLEKQCILQTDEKLHRIWEEDNSNKLKLIKHMLRWETAVYSRDNARRQIQCNPLQTSCKNDQFPTEVDGVEVLDVHDSDELVCGICYRTIQQHDCSIAGSELNEGWQIITRMQDHTELAKCFGMALKQCRHWFCNECWAYHLLSKIRQGDINLECPAYKCSHSLDNVTLLAILSYKLYKHHWARVQDFKLEQSNNWQWCPNKHCTSIARVVTSKQDDPCGEKVCIDCTCKTSWCFDCQNEAHWPVSCNAYNSYLQYVQSRGQKERDVFVVQVKKCPKCKYPINKNGGCSSMFCTMCKSRFCWECLTSWSDHVSNGLQCPRRVEETNWSIWEEDSVRINELMHLRAFVYRKLRLECTTSKFFSRLYRQASKFLLDETRNSSKKRHKRAKLFNGQLLQTFMQTNMSTESTMIDQIGAFLYQAYHILEFGFAALSSFPRKRLSGVLRKLEEFAFFISIIEQMLQEKSSKTPFDIRIRNIHDKMQNGKPMFVRVSKMICGKQKEIETARL